MMKFSIIIPCYNVVAYLREALESVLAQTYEDWECICVDDGSTDGTAAILDEYGRRDARFKVFHKVNEGVSAARNDAIKLASGDYVCFLDSDDVWAPDWLEKVVEASAGGVDIIRMQLTFWRDGDVGMLRAKIPTDVQVERYYGECAVLSWGWQTYTTDGYIVLNIVRRSLLIEHAITFPVGMKINEDIIFDLSLLPFAKCVAQSSYAGYFYRMRATSAWHSKRPIDGCTRYLAESIKLWKASRDALEALPCLSQVRRKEAFMFYNAVLQWLDFGLIEERRRSEEIVRLLREAFHWGMLDFRALPLYWRVAFRCVVIWGSFSSVVFVHKLLTLYHGIHRWMLRGVK